MNSLAILNHSMWHDIDKLFTVCENMLETYNSLGKIRDEPILQQMAVEKTATALSCKAS